TSGQITGDQPAFCQERAVVCKGRAQYDSHRLRKAFANHGSFLTECRLVTCDLAARFASVGGLRLPTIAPRFVERFGSGKGTDNESFSCNPNGMASASFED